MNSRERSSTTVSMEAAGMIASRAAAVTTVCGVSRNDTYGNNEARPRKWRPGHFRSRNVLGGRIRPTISGVKDDRHLLCRMQSTGESGSRIESWYAGIGNRKLSNSVLRRDCLGAERRHSPCSHYVGAEGPRSAAWVRTNDVLLGLGGGGGVVRHGRQGSRWRSGR